MRVALSQLDGSKTNLNGSASWVVDDWADRADLVAAIAGSTYIPCLSGLQTFNVFRNQPVIDGGYGNGFEQLCPGGDTSSAACLKLGTWYVGPLGNATCDPVHCDCSRGPDPERNDRVTALYENNPYVDRWALNRVADRCPPAEAPNAFVGSDPYPLPDFVPQYSTIPDIHPVRTIRTIRTIHLGLGGATELIT